MGLFIPRALFPARCSPCIDTHKDMGLHYNQELCLISVLMRVRKAAKHLHIWVRFNLSISLH